MPTAAVIAVLITITGAAGCDSVGQAVAQAKASAATVLAASPPASAAAPGAPTLAGAELAGLFKRFPLGSPQARDNYPRAAITIVSATPSILRIGGATADPCVRFNVRLWTDARTSRAFEGLQMCARDKSTGVPFRSLQSWPGQYVPTAETTGAVRTDGPRRPKTNFPTEARVADAWFDSGTQAIFYVGSILYQLGYDWDQPGEHRVWFVSAPSP